jgi:nitroreductase
MLEGGRLMNLMELMRARRSIRKYQDKQVPRADLEQILAAGTYAPNAGGGQRTMLVAIRDRALCDRLGRLNASSMDRSRLLGSYVSADQPSLIDDPTLPSGFYGAPTVCAVFSPRRFLYGEADAFCCAENLVLMAAELGVSSCIVARGEETFDNDLGRQLLAQWAVPEGYAARCFVLLGYCAGDYPQPKPRKAGRTLIVEEES